MIESLRNTFSGGWNTDSDKRMVRPNQFTDAQDVEFVSDEEGSLNSIGPVRSMELKYAIPPVDTGFCNIRLEWKYTGGFIETRVFNSDGQMIASPVNFAGDAYTNYISNLNASLYPYGVQVLVSGVEVYNGVTYISARFYSIPYTGISSLTDFSVTQIVDDIATKCPVLQYSSKGDTLIELTSATIDGKSFIISAGSQFGEVGVYDGTSYVSVYRSKKTVFTDQNPIDLRVEKTSDGRYALYFTDFNLKPKVLYVQSNISYLCTQKYTLTQIGAGTNGYIVLGFEAEQTNLQLINNNLFISYKAQLQGGGFLKSGGWRYVVRAGINGSNDVTNWSFPTPNVTPVFDTSIDSPNAFFNVQGKPGVTTSKVNVLTVEGINKYVYNFIEVGALYYVGTSIAAPSAVIIGRFDVTANTMDVHHIGNEIGSNLDIADIPQYDDVIEKVENLEIKKNRLNLSNVEIAKDEDISSMFSNVSISTGMAKLEMSGGLNSTNESILNLNAGGQYVYADGTSTPLNISLNFPWSKSMDKYSSFNTTSQLFIWPLSLSTGVIKCDISYGISIKGRGNPAELYYDPFINFYLIVWKYSGGTATKYYQNNEHSDESNDNTLYTRSLNLEGSPGDSFAFMYVITEVHGESGYHFEFTSNTEVSLKYLKEDVQSINVGEYLSPDNCSNKVGYMLNESYPFFCKVHYKNGYVSSPYYFGTHKFAFDASTINSDKIFTDSPSGTTIPNIANALEQQSAYVYFANISGIPIGSLRASADYISIWRGECNPTVMGTGVIMAADSISGDKNFTAGLYPSRFTSGCFYPRNATDNERKFGIFLSPDTSLNKTKYSGGKITTLGSPRLMSNNYNILGRQDGNSSKFGSYVEYFGNSNKNGSRNINVLAGNYVNFGTESQPLYNSTNNKKLVFNGDYQNSSNGSMAGIAVTLDDYLLKNSGDTSDDNGIYIAQYIIDTENQYDIQNVRIVPTGAKIRIDDFPNANYVNIQVFGGDTYTQKNYIRLCSWTKNVSTTYPFVPSSGIDEKSIFSSFIGYYGQARFNAQLTYNNGVDTPTFTLQGQKSIYDYLFPFKKIEDVVEEQFNYDAGYSAQDHLSRSLAYNSKNIQPSKFISRIYYSDKKPVASISDTYRKIKTNAYRDLDTKNGPIHGMIDQGDHMIVLQPYAVTPMVYNTDAFVSTTIGGIQTTAGDVYPLNQVPVSTYGPSTKSAVLKGLNRNGNTTTYWVSDWATKILRYGYDGVSVLSDNFYIKTFLLTYMEKSNINNDIVMGYRPRNQQVYLSFKQKGQSNKITIGWNEASNIFTGRYSFEPFRFSTYNDYLLSNQRSGSVYSIATGSDYLKWYGSNTINGTFIIEPVFNKLPEITKRAFAFALNVGEDALNFPLATVYSSQYSSTTNNFEHRRGELVATSLSDGNNDIMGQWINLRIETQSHINLLAVNMKVGYKRRLV
jgi:hypothetical protein